ncbi:hypothetical protein ACFQ1Q_05750 [Winogradskyella litorisediminis]|uniref:Lipoprotein n=1 Tax=Winogradskyella litorisediminis TaxID=1156618 RepID=A0ABW3N5V7_9FLAO
MKTTFKLLLITLVFFSCKKEVPVPENCGFKKTHVVDINYNDTYKLPPVEFTVDYTDNLEINLPKEGKKNYNFVGFVSKENDKLIERIDIGSYKLTGITKDKIDESLSNLLESVQGLFEFSYKLKDIVAEQKTINGKKVYTFEAVGTEKFDENENPEEFLIRTTLHSKEKLSPNGLMVMQVASKNGPIQTHDDFATKGCTSYVYRTLRFE